MADYVCGTGGWGGPLPGDPDNNSILSATPAFGGIDVSWSYPVTNPNAVAHTLLYRGTSASFLTAIERSVVAGNFFYDKVDTGLTYWYWIKIVSVNGTVGELIGPASATARPLIADLITQLTGQIDSGLLAMSLKGTLDNISLINSNLNAEIFDRETGETSFAAALVNVNAGVAAANSYITTEIASRVSSDAALAEQINLVAVTLGSDVAAVNTSLSSWITTVEGKVTDIGARYTAQVTVNGLVGGFGVYNNGATVEAGFDVDTFWVGRTALNKRKPFIIVGSETFIDEAVINKLTFSKLRDEAGAFVVENGRVKADYLKVSTASIDDAAITNAKIGYAAITTAKIADAAIGTAQIGTAAITSAKIGALEVNTVNIAGNSVTVSNSASGTAPSTNVTIPAGQTMSIVCLCHSAPMASGGSIAESALGLGFNGIGYSNAGGFHGYSPNYYSDSLEISARAVVIGPATVSASASGTNTGTITLILLGHMK